MTHSDMPPNDERGPDPDKVRECDACGGLWVESGWHYCRKGEHVGDVPVEVLNE